MIEHGVGFKCQHDTTQPNKMKMTPRKAHILNTRIRMEKFEQNASAPKTIDRDQAITIILLTLIGLSIIGLLVLESIFRK